MKKGGIGGGNTITGLIYEGKVDLAVYLARQKDYQVEAQMYYIKEKSWPTFSRSTNSTNFSKKTELIGET